MRKVPVLVNMDLQKKIFIEVEEGEEAKEKAVDMIYGLDHKKYPEFLSSLYLDDIYVREVTLELQVKMAIDRFDPYVILPGEDGPYDEYDGESSRIAAKINENMSKEEVSDVIAKEFSESFNQNYSRERCMGPAEEIYEFLTRLK